MSGVFYSFPYKKNKIIVAVNTKKASIHSSFLAILKPIMNKMAAIANVTNGYALLSAYKSIMF